MRVIDIESIRIKLASPEDVLSWSKGEVTKPETINYRTQRPEKDGLFCEKVFGPTKDFECYCGKYKRVRYKGMVCDKCGVMVTKAQVRRERMGHIKLATPCSHIWFLRGVPSRIGMVLDIPMQQLEKVIYFSAYLITSINKDAKKGVLEEIEKEYKREVKNKNIPIKELRVAKEKAKEEVMGLKLLRVLSEQDYHNMSLKYGEVFEAGTGGEALTEIFKKIDLKKEINNLEKEMEEATPGARRKILIRLKFFQGMLKAKIRPEWMFLTALPVLPPDLRPMVQLDGGRFASSDLNDLYRRIINRNNRLKYLLEINAPEVIVKNEKRMLQEAVDSLIDNGMRRGGKIMTAATTGGKRTLKSLADILKGKQGRFRRNLLGKRVDYSGRSVIVVGPKLKFNQVGIPKKMALELFKPFVIKKIMEKELAYNVRGASRLIDEKIDEVWASLEEIVKTKLVLLNRAPTLHRLGIQAFYPILIEGEAIQLHPMVCRAFNADFDGDQMAVHLPLSDLAQKEAKEIMLSGLNLLNPATGTPVVSLDQDISLGCYVLTKIKEGAKGEGKVFSDTKEVLVAYEFGNIDLNAKIKCPIPEKGLKGLVETTVGRIIFNQALPENYPFQNLRTKKSDLEKITRDIIQKHAIEEPEVILDKIKALGFKHATWSGVSWGMDDLIIPPEKSKILEEAEKETAKIEELFNKGFFTKEEKRAQAIEVWSKAKTKIEELVPKTLPENGSVFQIIDSKSKGSWSQPSQMAGMKGLVVNPAGQTIELPIKNSFKQGFDILEYFISTHGARKGLSDTALRTSSAGYLTRRLVDAAHEIVITEEDCQTEKGIVLLRKNSDEINQNFIYKILGRISLEAVDDICHKGEIIDWEKAEKIVTVNIEKIKVRSPLTCELKYGICQKCYGWDLGKNSLVKIGEAVGVIAAQAIGEPGTQLTMRIFHIGGVAGKEDIAMGLPRVQEVFETRTPKGKAEISQTDGKVLEITPEKIIRIKVENSGETKPKKSQKLDDIIEYKPSPRAAIWVKPGQEVKKGQQLSEGSLDSKELFKLVGTKETQDYIIKEIQKIYASQGALIHDKHIEIICRQMFSRVKIKDSGNSFFSQGEVVERARFLEEVASLEKEKNKKLPKATPVLLGITRIALTTDSFLSAASFQETSRVLIKSSLEGKEDKLRGLKENVIIGKMIPAGTGFKK